MLLPFQIEYFGGLSIVKENHTLTSIHVIIVAAMVLLLALKCLSSPLLLLGVIMQVIEIYIATISKIATVLKITTHFPTRGSTVLDIAIGTHDW